MKYIAGTWTIAKEILFSKIEENKLHIKIYK